MFLAKNDLSHAYIRILTTINNAYQHSYAFQSCVLIVLIIIKGKIIAAACRLCAFVGGLGHVRNTLKCSRTRSADMPTMVGHVRTKAYFQNGVLFLVRTVVSVLTLLKCIHLL